MLSSLLFASQPSRLHVVACASSKLIRFRFCSVTSRAREEEKLVFCLATLDSRSLAQFQKWHRTKASSSRLVDSLAFGFFSSRWSLLWILKCGALSSPPIDPLYCFPIARLVYRRDPKPIAKLPFSPKSHRENENSFSLVVVVCAASSSGGTNL